MIVYGVVFITTSATSRLVRPIAQSNRQRTNFREFNFSARPLPVWKWRSWHGTVLARFSLSSNILVLYLYLCAWILNRLCTARSVYVGQSYAKCGYKSTQYTYKLLICTTKMSGEDETKCVELTALEKNNESKEINQRSVAVSNKNKAGSKQDCNRKWRWIKLRPMRTGTLFKMQCLCTPYMGC